MIKFPLDTPDALCAYSTHIHRMIEANNLATEAKITVTRALHRGLQMPVLPGCPVVCLGLSLHAYNRLIHAHQAPCHRPRTVRDVVQLARHGELEEIWGLGPKRIAEITASLVYAGFDIEPEHPRNDHESFGRAAG